MCAARQVDQRGATAQRGEERASSRPRVSAVSGSRLTTMSAGSAAACSGVPSRRQPAAAAVAERGDACRGGTPHLALAEHEHRQFVGTALHGGATGPGAAVRHRRRSRGAATARPTAPSRPSHAFMAGSTMRAIGTPAGRRAVGQQTVDAGPQALDQAQPRQPLQAAGRRVGDDGGLHAASVPRAGRHATPPAKLRVHRCRSRHRAGCPWRRGYRRPRRPQAVKRAWTQALQCRRAGADRSMVPYHVNRGARIEL
jgi:hypothetical protein